MSSSGESSNVKGILKKRGSGKRPADSEHRRSTTDSGIQWDEMNILMTEHPEGKDYGHMKIDEPKTPYHEMIPDEEPGPSTTSDQFFSPEDLAQKVQEASKKPQDADDWEGDDSSEEEASEATKEHKKQFTEWRKKHYNEFFAIKRAKELMKQDEEELLALEKEKGSTQDAAAMDEGDETYHTPMDEGQS